jgi:probable HAF family extracellular repeat protein
LVGEGIRIQEQKPSGIFSGPEGPKNPFFAAPGCHIISAEDSKMITFRRIFGYVVIAMLLGAGVAYASHYAYLPVDYPGARETSPNGINTSGQMVGYYSDANNYVHGFLKVGTSYTPLDYPGARATAALGINDSGQIVGEYQDASGDSHGFLKAGDTYTPIDYPGATATYPYGINISGQMVGWYQ